MSQDRQLPKKSWQRGTPGQQTPAQKKRKQGPNYHSDNQKPLTVRGATHPASKKAGKHYSNKVQIKRKKVSNKKAQSKYMYKPYTNSPNTKAVLPRVALLQANKKPRYIKKSYKHLYEKNNKKEVMTHSRSGPKPVKGKGPHNVTLASKSAGNSRAKRGPFGGSRDVKKKKRFRYKLSSKKNEEKVREDEKRKREVREKRDREQRQVDAQKNVMKLGKRMIHHRQNKDNVKDPKKKKLTKFQKNRGTAMGKYGYGAGVGYGTAPVRDLVQGFEPERMRSIPAKQPRRGFQAGRNTGSLQPKMTRAGRIPNNRKSNKRESHTSKKGKRVSNTRHSGIRSSNVKSSNIRPSNKRSSNARPSNKRSSTLRSSKMRSSNLKSSGARGTSEMYTSKGYDTRGSNQNSSVSYPSYPSNSRPKNRANLYKPKNRIKRNKTPSTQSNQFQTRQPKRSQTKPEIMPLKNTTQFLSFGKRKSPSGSKHNESVIFRREQKILEDTLLEVEGQLNNMSLIRKSTLREKTKRSLSKKRKTFLKSANLGRMSPLNAHKGLRLNKTDQNLTESEIRESLIEGMSMI